MASNRLRHVFCGETMSHIVDSCHLANLDGGLSRLHFAEDDAVQGLANLGRWLWTYILNKKKGINTMSAVFFMRDSFCVCVVNGAWHLQTALCSWVCQWHHRDLATWSFCCRPCRQLKNIRCNAVESRCFGASWKPASFSVCWSGDFTGWLSMLQLLRHFMCSCTQLL